VSTVEQLPTSPPQRRGGGELTVSVVIPCLNEAENIALCVNSARAALEDSGLRGEVIVVDNASEDGSGSLAQAAGARVVLEPRRGYGNAYLAGFAAARGRYIVMADADLTYDFGEIPRFIAALEAGAQLVIGNRMNNIQPGAMPWTHRYIGNPVLTGLLNILFRTGVGDAHCGMRALRRDVLEDLDLRTTGMEFASEMVIRAAKAHLTISEIAIEYRPRGGSSKLSRFRDGWRHLRFLLVHSPTYLFIVPGALLALVGVLISLTVLVHIDVLGRSWDTHALIGGLLITVIGTQVISLGRCAHTYGTYHMAEQDAWFDWARARVRLEHGLALGGGIALAGLVTAVIIVVRWANHGFGSLAEENLAIIAAELVVVGLQIFFSSFLLSILGLRRPDAR